MRDLKNVLTAAVLTTAFVVAAVPASAQTGRIGGTVRDTNQQPIKGATVTAENPNASPSSFTATTDDKGRYSIIGLKSGAWKITASAPGFQPSSGQVPVRTIGTPMPPVDFALAPGATGPAGALAGVNTKELQAELQKAEELMSSQQYDAAIASYQAMLAKAPALTMINMQIGRAYRMKKDYESAIAAYKKILESDPANDRAKVEIGMTNLEKGDLAAADAALSEAAQSTSASREVFYSLGEVKFAKGETDEAVKYYQRAADVDPSWGKPIFKMGLAKLQKADTAGAIEMMNKVIAADPNSAEAAQAKALIEQLKKG
jgi:tetratricopeptide (TPR) repeat protein